MEQNIGIVGLGLMGGSMAKAVKWYTGDRVTGFDANPQVVADALAEGSIDAGGEVSLLSRVDLLILALYPEDTLTFLREHIGHLKQGVRVVDFCGVKEYVCRPLEALCRERGIVFVGGHPMAGREYSGYRASCATLFENSSMILVPTAASSEEDIAFLSDYFRRLGFSQVVVTTADNHDRMIAFTSQLAHIVSNAYIKSPEAVLHDGYSAGSYKDLTRVARLNADMWTQLFLCNRDPLLREMELLLDSLREYRDALAQSDAERLRLLLWQGSERKDQIDKGETVIPPCPGEE